MQNIGKMDQDAEIDGCRATSKKCSIGKYFKNIFEAFPIGGENIIHREGTYEEIRVDYRTILFR